VIGYRLEETFHNSDFVAWEKSDSFARRAADDRRGCVRLFILAVTALCTLAGVTNPTAHAQSIVDGAAGQASSPQPNLPPRVLAAQRFLAQRGWSPATGSAISRPASSLSRLSISSATAEAANASISSASTATWQPIGPTAVQTPDFGLVTGRVAAVALDPSDATGNRLFLGTTGGGVWVAQNAATSNASSVVFTPLTDSVGALNGAFDASISIGALTVQPGGTGVILAGTGDPNDVLDSYYGAGILRSTDNGNSWSLVSRTSDVAQGLGVRDVRFYGEGVAGFAWSTVNPQLVVAAVSQAYEGAVVNAVQPNTSYQGLYYSTDRGTTWLTATISDGGSNIVQGPLAAFAAPDGNAATSVVWNPVRKLFIAAVRFHGYYQSADGVTWTRMTAQPGSSLTTILCPTNPGSIGSIACPIYRGTLAVNPSTGDTFAWTVDLYNQDQGLWQDPCGISGSTCTNPSVTFAQRWNTSPLDANTPIGAATVLDGSYTLALSAIPGGLGAGQDTLLFAGADDLWKCSLAAGCVWRNETNAATCKSAQVGAYQHALAWNSANPAEVFIGNDSGLWRSTDAGSESGQACTASDAQHFRNLNGNLGSLAEVISLASVPSTSSRIMAGLGVNGTTGVKNNPTPTEWPQILGGYGGPVAIDPTNPDNWYVNSQAGVSIYRCTNSSDCAAADFGSSPVVSNANAGGDGLAMQVPAPFLVDPLDSSQLLIGTCRVWRGPVNGSSWSSSNAVSPVLDGKASPGPCSGDALIRSIAAVALPGGTERVYVGMYGLATFGANLAGHVLGATINPASSTLPTWQDLTLNPVSNDSVTLNKYGMDISSVFIDPLDTTGNTVYLTVEGARTTAASVQTVYRSIDGGAHWANLTANLPGTPASAILVDPQNSSTIYLATDEGVYFTNQVASCAVTPSSCWSIYGTGLPAAPIVSLGVATGTTSPALLAGTYGRGIWQAPFSNSVTSLTSVTANPTALTYTGQAVGTFSTAQTITLQNTGSAALTVTSIQVSGDFSESDNCTNIAVAAAASCAIQVAFAPNSTGSRTGQLVIGANVAGGQLSVNLSGTGLAGGSVVLSPTSLDFGQVTVGATSALLPEQATNSGAAAVPINSVTITGPFVLATNSCGTMSLAANTSCQMQIRFAPTQAGAASGALTFVDSAGTQTVLLTGTGQSVATDTLSTTALSFPATATGALSDAQTASLTNSGDVALNSIAVTVSGPFQASNSCGGQLAAHASCSISVIFAPTQKGSLSGTLSVADAMRTQMVSLNGTAVAQAVLSVTPSSLSFSTQLAGVASAPQTLTVSNTGAAPMANVGFQLTGPAAASYSINATNCGATLNAAGSCTAQVGFTPAATGVVQAALIVSSSTVGVAPVSIPLNGSGQIGAGITATPAQAIFATTGVGQSSSAQTVTISNGSSYTVSSLAIAVNAPFALSQNNCTGALQQGASCGVALTFQPTASGPATGTLSIGSPDLAVPASAALSGTGFDFAVAPSGTGSLTVASGQTANYAMTINPAGGTTGTFTFACGTVPDNAVCSFNPASATISAGATGSVTVSIATGKASNARSEAPAAWRTLPLLCGLLLAPWARARRRRALLHLLLLVLFVSGMASCSASSGGSTGGGSPVGGGGSGSSSATPAGTYTVPVTVASTGVAHTITLTLTVD
jgi:hypothetical protein